MSIRRLADRDIGLEDDCDPQELTESQHLVLAIKELLDRLAEQNHVGPTTGTEEVETWEGGGYFYVETVLSSAVDVEIEVNIQGGRAFIRMAR